MSFHERAVKADKEAREYTRARPLKKYPYIDLSRFKILTHIDNDAIGRTQRCCLYGLGVCA